MRIPSFALISVGLTAASERAYAFTTTATKGSLPQLLTKTSSSSSTRLWAESRGRGEEGAGTRRNALLWTGGVLAGSWLWGSSAARVRAEEAAGTPEVSPGTAATPPLPTTYELEVPYRGEDYPLTKFRGKAVLVVNTKTEDPEALNQVPALVYLNQKYAKDQLKIWMFPTEQGTFEEDESEVIRIRHYNTYGFGQYPNAVIFDKVNVAGKGAHPLYRYMTRTLKNPNRIARITLDFEKFLLDENGVPVRRYPRKYSAYEIEPDIKALLTGQPLPPPSSTFLRAWRDAGPEAERSEYAFKKGLNYYDPL